MAETQALQKHSSLNQHPWLVPAFQNKVQHFAWCPTVFPIFARSWGFYTLCCTGRQWGSRQQHQTGFCLKHSCFMVKTLLDAVTCVMINVDWMLQTGFKNTCILQNQDNKEGQAEIIPLSFAFMPESFHMVACHSGAHRAVAADHQSRSSRCQSPCCGEETSPWTLLSMQKEQTPMKSTFLRYFWVMVN